LASCQLRGTKLGTVSVSDSGTDTTWKRKGRKMRGAATRFTRNHEKKRIKAGHTQNAAVDLLITQS
jgi:hypothetical protein